MINRHLHRSIPGALLAGAVIAVVAAGRNGHVGAQRAEKKAERENRHDPGPGLGGEAFHNN